MDHEMPTDLGAFSSRSTRHTQGSYACTAGPSLQVFDPPQPIPLVEVGLREAWLKDVEDTLSRHLDVLSASMSSKFDRMEMLIAAAGSNPLTVGQLSGQVSRAGSRLYGLSNLDQITRSSSKATFSPYPECRTPREVYSPRDLSKETPFSDGLPSPVGEESPRGNFSTAFGRQQSSLLVFAVRPGLETDALTEHAAQVAMTGLGHCGSNDSLTHIAAGNSTVELMRPPHRWITRPNSTFRTCWDSIGLVLILYDLVLIPLTLGFHIEDHLVTDIMFWICLLFWMADVGMSCTTGFYKKGTEELRPRVIIKRYLRTWFPFDLVVISSDWFTWVWSNHSGENIAQVSRTFRVLRVVRSIRLLRLVKLQRVLTRIMETFKSEYLVVLLGILKGIGFLILMNHIIACLWFGISSWSADDGEAWVKSAGFTDDHGIGYQYVTALHWSLTQFTPASMEVYPRNMSERIFAVCVLICAFVVFSSFLSNITASVNELRQLSMRHDKNMMLLRKYLSCHAISSTLTTRILKYVEYQVSVRRQEIRQSDVEFLGILSTQLQMELVQESTQPILCRMPFLNSYAGEGVEAIRELCNKAATRHSYSIGDTIFSRATSPTGALFMISGYALYRLKKAGTSMCGGRGASLSTPEEAVKVGEWCSEAALWTAWRHVGTLTAVDNCEVLVLDGAKLLEITRKHPRVFAATVCYANKFVNWLNDQAEDGALTDLNGLNKDTTEMFIAHAFYGTGMGDRYSSGNAVLHAWRLLFGHIDTSADGNAEAVKSSLQESTASESDTANPTNSNKSPSPATQDWAGSGAQEAI